MNAIGTTGYKPVGYEDETGEHKAKGIKVAEHIKELPAIKGKSKCGDGKYGAGKCGASKCGTSK